ncbi:hypothetical protein SAMN02745121_07812 [Nannocystis exedens]|uniref:Uncharacterized protein n=1 Tax=Nannocystis exedens TaxID=54 RepID=A0A1I2HA66_9BACT|nr:hypothetical protein [Nannocystis exedens]PCC70041.1 hypothetical protein NAEX_03074 [Nannocystis exedens]SFF26468.1 hypothetical protein SAMN02745121_07812 [Nannocystis exedens]
MQLDDLLASEGYAAKDVPALLAWARARANVLLQGLDPDSTLGELLGGTSGHVSRDSSPAARRDGGDRRDSVDRRDGFERRDGFDRRSSAEEREDHDEHDGEIPADLRQAVTAATTSQPQPAPYVDDDPDSGLGGFARFQSILKLNRPYPYRQQEPVVDERPTLARSFALAAQREVDYSPTTPSPPGDLSATLPLAAALGISSEESAALVLGIPDEDTGESSGLSDLFYPDAGPDIVDAPRSSTTVSSRTSSHASGFIDDDDDVRMPIQDDDDLPLPTLQDDEVPPVHGEASPLLDDEPPLGVSLGPLFESNAPVRRTSLDDVRRLDDAAPVRRASMDDVRHLVDAAPVRRASMDDVRGVLVDDDDAAPVLRASLDEVRRGDDRSLRGASIEDVRRPGSAAPVRRSSLDDVRGALVDDDEVPATRGSAPVRRSSLDDVRGVLVDDDEAPATRGSAPVRRSSQDDVRGVLVDDDEAPATRASAPVRRSSLDDVRGVLVDDDEAPSLSPPPTQATALDDDETIAEPVRTRDTPPMPGLPAVDVDGDSGAPVLRHRTPKKKVVELGAPLAKPRAGSGGASRGPTPKPAPPRKPPPPPARKPPPPPPPPVDDDIQELSRVELIEDLPPYLRDDDE